MHEEENLFEALENFICARCKLELPFVNSELVKLGDEVVYALTKFREGIVKEVLSEVESGKYGN